MPVLHMECEQWNPDSGCDCDHNPGQLYSLVSDWDEKVLYHYTTTPYMCTNARNMQTLRGINICIPLLHILEGPVFPSSRIDASDNIAYVELV